MTTATDDALYACRVFLAAERDTCIQRQAAPERFDQARMRALTTLLGKLDAAQAERTGLERAE